ncbi:DNA-directed RNA polymerase subunit alpha [Candidatus Wolfebacteria bacterium GWA1_42_9]|uniref:DNA-directed RNA polymerase subunit alpha n=1 Tax=Candidatus Wolfebacteria bacterium GWA1_42_9 TaxID=1802553 RepID=A0A1F8DQ15_9BACT|nr:MAG: DNA-directed RNA polymerase subunit alpha [Candidatus Wolfebacteria bacterium GWA1_42_9]
MKTVSESASEGVFEISGLYRGYGMTLGNSLRRVLLSSLPGAAATQIKIKGVKHEFSTISDVLEDVVDITINIKKIRFKIFSDEPQVLTLKKKGAGKITAGDFKANAQIEIVNPEVHLATITSKSAELDMEIVVEKGLGYSPVETRKTEKLPIGSIAIDALFTPVVNVNFEVENMRVGDRTDYNRLILTIETDKTITPSQALHKAASIFKDHIEIVLGVNVKDESGAKKKESEVKKATKKSKK